VSDDTQDERGDEPEAAPVNPAPPEVAVAAFIAREAVAFLFVAFWLLLFAASLVTGAFVLPFWYHCVAVGVLGYALGVNVATLTAARPPDTGGVARRLRERREGRERRSPPAPPGPPP